MKFYKALILTFIVSLFSVALPVKAVNKPHLFINPPEMSTRETEIGITNVDRLEICKVELTVNFPKNLLTVESAPGYDVINFSNDRGEIKYTASLETCMSDYNFQHFPSIIFNYTKYGEEYVYFSSAKAYDSQNRLVDIIYDAAIIGPYSLDGQTYGSSFNATTYAPPIPQAAQNPAPKPTPKPSAITSPKPTPTKPTLSLQSKNKLTSSNKSIEISPTDGKATIYPQNKLSFSGTTSPNAKVTLTIHSDPITAEVTADAQGVWTYTLDPQVLNIPTGEHIVTAVSTDTNGVSSDSIELTKFTLNPTPQPVEPLKPEPYNYFNRMTIGGGVVVLLLIGLFIILRIIRKKRKQPKQSQIHQEEV